MPSAGAGFRVGGETGQPLSIRLVFPVCLTLCLWAKSAGVLADPFNAEAAEAQRPQRKISMHVAEKTGRCIVSAGTTVHWVVSPHGFSDFGGRPRLLFSATSAFSANSALNDELRAAPDNNDEMPAGIEDNFASSPSLGMAGPWHPADSAFPVRVKMLKPPYARIAIQPHRRSSRLSAFIRLQKTPSGRTRAVAAGKGLPSTTLFA